MANNQGQITVNNLKVIESDTDPTTGGGLAAEIGSLALSADGAGIFNKIGAGDTLWSQFLDSSALVTIAQGGTNSGTALNNDFVMVSSGGAIVESSTITATELGLLNGIASVSTGAGDNDKFVTQGYVDDAVTAEDFWTRTSTTLNTQTVADSVKLGAAGVADASVLFELASTTKGFSLMNMTNLQRNAIGSPVDGLQIYNLDFDRIDIYDLVNSQWESADASRDGYLFFYDTTVQSVTVANTFQTLNFNNLSVTEGWGSGGGAHIPSLTGKHLVTVSVGIEKTAGAPAVGEIRALFNSVEVPGSQVSVDIITNNLVQEMTTTFILDAVAGQTLVMQFTGGTTSVQIASAGGNATATPSVRMTIQRLD